jgi:hypothetical protein
MTLIEPGARGGLRVSRSAPSCREKTAAIRVSADMRAAWPDCENVDNRPGISTVEDHPPLTDTQPLPTLGTAQQLDVALGQRALSHDLVEIGTGPTNT